jgi:chromosome segregation ATPase
VDKLASVTGDLARLIHAVSAPSVAVAGVGLKVKCEERTRLCAVTSITRGGAADCSGLISLGDTLLSVNGEVVRGMTVDEIQHLIQGALGTRASLVLRRNQNESSRYEAELVRSVPGVQQREVPLSEQTLDAIRIAEDAHAHIKELHTCRRRELAERAELEDRQNSLTTRVRELEAEEEKLEAHVRALSEEKARVEDEMEDGRKECGRLRGQVSSLIAELEARHNSQMAEVSAVEEQYHAAGEELAAAKRKCQFLEERQRQYEEDCCHLGQENEELKQEITAGQGQLEALQVRS